MKIGDYAVRRPHIGEHLCEPRRGRVVYIHPEGRFFTLEFTFDGVHGPMSFRESFPMIEAID